MRTGLLYVDRTAVLFLGIAAGAAIGYAFAAGRGEPPPRPATPPAARPGQAKVAAALLPGRPDIAQECALPFQPHLLEAVAAGRPVTIGVFGDSFGDGVWSALYRLLPARESFRVLKYSQQSTGFTRYASLNLEQHASEQIAADGPVDVAVVSFGANDTQGVYAGGHAAPLMSPEWQRVIGGRVDGFVRLMRARGATVYWLGLPKMRAAGFDADIAAMNDFYEGRMKALRVPFIDIRPLTTDAAGEYAPYLPDPVSNEKRLMRANDGVHMSMNGYVVITRALAERIKAYVAAARVMTGEVPPVPGPIAAPPTPQPRPAPRPERAAVKPKPVIRAPEPAPAEPKPSPEAPPAKQKPQPQPATKPEAEPAPKPKPDAPAPAKKPEPAPAARPKTEAPTPAKKPEPAPPAKPKAEAPPAAKKPDPAAAPKPKVDAQPAAKPKVETPPAAKPKPDAKPAAKPPTDKAPAKPPAASPSRPPLQLNLPPPEETGRKPASPPPADEP